MPYGPICSWLIPATSRIRYGTLFRMIKSTSHLSDHFFLGTQMSIGHVLSDHCVFIVVYSLFAIVCLWIVMAVADSISFFASHFISVMPMTARIIFVNYAHHCTVSDIGI